jgi:Domain of unknown function (DUF4265)
VPDKDSLVKVHFELQEPEMGVGGESLWAAPVGPNLYELRNSPWHVRTVNWLDVVEAVPEAKDQWPEFIRVHKRSGHRTFHVYILNDERTRKDEILQRCNELGCTREGMNNRMYALDFRQRSTLTQPSSTWSRCKKRVWLTRTKPQAPETLRWWPSSRGVPG